MTETLPRPTIEPPARMARLPKDPNRPYLVPWFVAWIDGKPDFRVIRSNGIRDAVVNKTCWLCGGPLGRYMAFVIGPMCAVNCISSEPPAHRDCAVYAARTCPFLTRPTMRRRPVDEEVGTVNPAGIAILRNPGVALVWVTRSYQVVRDPEGDGVLFNVGVPTETLWYAEGRDATRDEVLASLESGMPTLMELAEADGPDAVDRLNRQAERVRTQLIPA